MTHLFRHIGLLTLVALLAISCNQSNKYHFDEILAELDESLDMREYYSQLKEQRIELKKSSLLTYATTYKERMGVIEDLVGEYEKYQLDSTLVWINRGISLALKNGDTRKADALRLRMLDIYSKGGFYNEATAILGSIDTLNFSEEEMRMYYHAAHSHHRELREYSADPKQKALSGRLEEYYIDRLIATEKDSLARHKLLCNKYSNKFDWEGMARELDIILPTLSPESQEFAYYSYLKALSVGDNRGTLEEYVTHLARSARADMVNSTTDHASLCMLSEILFHTDHIEHAFRYIQLAMQDATFFNSRLRPWQVATLLPVIEHSYSQKMESQQRNLFKATRLISLLLLILLFVLFQKNRQNRQIRQTKAQLEEMNTKLSEYVTRLSEQNKIEHSLAAELSEANTVKEQYIALFLIICSNYIDLLKNYHYMVRNRILQGAIDSLTKEIKNSTIIKDAEEEFYTNFDNAFLNLYPTFVEEFNALLKEGEQFVLKNPRVLNTELRIFALIKLGITDSSRIASLLRYSVNTIYNYRAGVKNKAAISREDFEHRVRKIGSASLDRA